jgi:hypothetical protein
MQEIEILSPPPKEEGWFLHCDSLYGKVHVFGVIEHEPLQYASDKEKLKYNPNNNKYFAIPKCRYRNCVGMSGYWSKEINKLNLKKNNGTPQEDGVYIFYGNHTRHHESYKKSVGTNEEFAKIVEIYTIEKRFSTILKKEVFSVVEEQYRNVEKYNGVWYGPFEFKSK